MQAMLQSCQQCLGWEQFNASRCQFDRQWQSIQTHTNLGDGTSVRVGHTEIGLESLSTLKEQCSRCILHEDFALCRLFEVGHRKWGNQEFLLALDVQHGTARYQELQPGAGY